MKYVIPVNSVLFMNNNPHKQNLPFKEPGHKQNLPFKEPGNKGNLSSAENVYIPMNPNLKYL
jgi:hypothetical protein